MWKHNTMVLIGLKRERRPAFSQGKNLASENMLLGGGSFCSEIINTISHSISTRKPNASSVLKVMGKVFWTIEKVKCLRKGNKEIHNHSRRFQCLLQPQLHAYFYLWLLIEAGQIPPQNLLYSTVWIIFKDSPAGQNIKSSLYCSHITFISYQYNNINFNINFPSTKGK